MKLKIAIIGNGNVAYHLAKRLHESGNPIVALIVRDQSKASEFQPFLASGGFISSSVDFVNNDWDLVIIAVADAAIAPLISTMIFHKNATVAHTSGSESIAVFNASAIDHFGVLYPLQTFSKEKNIHFDQVPIFIETNGAKAQTDITLASGFLSSKISVLNSEKRLRLHLAAVITCNFTNALYAVAEKEIQNIGLELSTIVPLIMETAEKAIAIGPKKAQTGPALRGDNSIIDEHLKLLSNSPELETIYRQLTKLIENSKIEP